MQSIILQSPYVHVDKPPWLLKYAVEYIFKLYTNRTLYKIRVFRESVSVKMALVFNTQTKTSNWVRADRVTINYVA